MVLLQTTVIGFASDSVRIDWRFTTQDARVKLKKLSPSIEPGRCTRRYLGILRFCPMRMVVPLIPLAR